MVGLALTVVLIFGAAMAQRFGKRVLQIIFWVMIGLAASSFFQYGIGAIIALALGMAVVLWFVKGGRTTLKMALNALAEGAKHALPVGVACAAGGAGMGGAVKAFMATFLLKRSPDCRKEVSKAIALPPSGSTMLRFLRRLSVRK